jgi:hypothetical protein
MQFRLWLGVVTFIAGGVLWYVANRDRELVPRWLPRLALGVASLGLGTLAFTQPGFWWSIGSICCSLVAIVLIFSVIRERLKR